ncbi:MAG: hypothetical protein KKA73_07110 [Chloroflexi bacterium]|nr:hypothetical protein [Chloroflexota bacterium]MBU1747439.1 hypothetical protein [Chloroflexota bacterium]
MKPSLEEEQRIRLISDGDLYGQAQDFSCAHLPVEGKQMAGLLEFSRSWDELTAFVRHQKDDRDWGEPGKSKKAHYKDFYAALDTYLGELRTRVQSPYGFVPLGKLDSAQRNRRDWMAGLLAREFIQHLVAEMMWKEETRS